jgi:hypothetical protein
LTNFSQKYLAFAPVPCGAFPSKTAKTTGKTHICFGKYGDFFLFFWLTLALCYKAHYNESTKSCGDVPQLHQPPTCSGGEPKIEKKEKP